MTGYTRANHRWTIRRWNGSWWMFTLILPRDSSAHTALVYLRDYRRPIYGGGRYRAFIERVDPWHEYKVFA